MPTRTMASGLRAAGRATAFVVDLMPMLPSAPRLSLAPIRERVVLESGAGEGLGDVFRPARGGGRPGVALSLGVVPAGLEHPQIPRLGRALARAGFVALVYWSPAMQDRRLDPDDVDDLAAAFEHLSGLPGVDPARCGLFGTCVGGAFALLAAAHPRVRDRVAFVGAFAPYASVETFVQSIASRTRRSAAGRSPWMVDPLTWTVYVRTITDVLPPEERDALRAGFETPDAGPSTVAGLGADALAVRRLLEPVPFEQTGEALAGLPDEIRRRFSLMSPLDHLDGIRAPLVVVGHDRDDLVIPVEESRRLRGRLLGRPGFRYTEFGLFEHADPSKRRLALHRRGLELGKFVRYAYPLFRV